MIDWDTLTEDKLKEMLAEARIEGKREAFDRCMELCGILIEETYVTKED